MADSKMNNYDYLNIELAAQKKAKANEDLRIQKLTNRLTKSGVWPVKGSPLLEDLDLRQGAKN